MKFVDSIKKEAKEILEKRQEKKLKKEINPNKKKHKTNWVNVFAGFVSVAIVFVLIGCIVGLLMLNSMLKTKPTLNVTDFKNSESSKIFDRDGEVIAELGVTIRENVAYNELPNNVIDAFVAVEDSRFFEHNGFDLPRFTKAILENIKTLSFGQGGSTFTMQLVKNVYFTNDQTGQNASRSGLSGVQRKVQEIALALELEHELTKEQILELYLNKLNFGGSRNIRGIQKASLYYFGKPINDVNLSEAAFLAGVVNAPNAYNPFYHLEAATRRRNNVLDLMEIHGYITSEECDLAKSIKLEDLLVEENNSSGSIRGSNNGIPYQAYIDAVVDEVYQLTGLDPYTTTMNVYTYMDKDIQTLIDDIQAGNTDGYIPFPDDYFECASICTNVKTGEIVGILGGRRYADGGQLMLNLAIDQYKQPGSSIKPIMDYVLAFETLGWSTSHVLVDKPIVYVGTDIVINNSDHVYRGQVSLLQCIYDSLNTTALQTLQQVVNKVGSTYVCDYLNTIGYQQASAENFNVQWGIGGGEFYVSCKQMASALGMITNKGQYFTPHTVKRIEYANGKSPTEPVYTGVQAVSEQAAWLMCNILEKNVSGGYGNLMFVLKENDYAVYGKTGTTDWGTSGRDFGIPDGAIKDGWCIAATSDFSVATWIGYTKASADTPSYMDIDLWNKCVKEKITNLILDKSVEIFGKPEGVRPVPSGISEISHIIGTYPYANPIPGMSDEYITTGYIISKYANLVSPETINILDIDKTKCGDPEYTNSTGVLSLTWPEYPDKDALKVADSTMDLTLKKADGTVLKEATGTRKFDYSWVYGAVRYKANITITDSEGKVKVDEKISTENNTYQTKDYNIEPGDKISVVYYYGFEHGADSNKTEPKVKEVQDEDVTVAQPNADQKTTIEALKAWARDNNIPVENVTLEEKNPGSDKIGTVEVFFDGNLRTDVINCKASQLKKITAKIYIEKFSAIAKHPGNEKFIVGASVEIEANRDISNYNVDIGSGFISNVNKDGKLLTFNIKDSATVGEQIKVTLFDKNGNTYEVSFTIE